MTTLSLRLPESLHQGLKHAVQQEGVSINQLITVAIAEKLSALLTEQYLTERAERGSQASYLAALAQVPDVEPDDFDRFPITASVQGIYNGDHQGAIEKVIKPKKQRQDMKGLRPNIK